MPANLSPDYHAAEARFKAASSPAEKIEALEEMLSVIPKHKGTERLQGDLKARLAKLRQKPAGKSGPRTHTHHIPKEGAGQIALVGPPNTGKSSLVKRLTRAEPEVAEYPFTTREATPGMMPFEDIAFQLIDLPPLSDVHVEPWVFDLARACDLAWIVVDVANSLDGLAIVKGMLEEKRIRLFPVGTPPPEEATGVFRPAILVVTGRDRREAKEDLEILRSLLEEPWPIVPVSSIDGSGLEDLGRATFEALRILRVYTKQPGKPADTDSPFALTIGATVGDLAERIHKDLAETMKFARIWGPSAHDGQTVHRDHVLAEGDVVEIHA